MFAIPDLRGKSNEEKNKVLDGLIIKHQNRVVFNTDELCYRGTSMKAGEVNLPYEHMDIFFKIPYKINGEEIDKVIMSKNEGLILMCIFNFKTILKVKVFDTGEILIGVQDQSDWKERMKGEEDERLTALDETINGEYFGREELFKVKEDIEKHYYNFVYDVLATIDYLNHSETVVTTHTTTDKNGKQVKLPKGRIERRIKIKHTHKMFLDNLVNHHKGSKHRYKYRVRGFYRTLADGKEVWVKDHVRGGDGSIFIPKEYEF